MGVGLDNYQALEVTQLGTVGTTAQQRFWRENLVPSRPTSSSDKTMPIEGLLPGERLGGGSTPRTKTHKSATAIFCDAGADAGNQKKQPKKNKILMPLHYP